MANLIGSVLTLWIAAESLEPSLDRLREAVAGVAAGAEGQMGIAIEHLETGRAIAVNGELSFPMASTFKLAVLAALFHQAEEGTIRLSDMVSLESEDAHIGSGDLSDFRLPGVSLSIENLALLMMRISDNSAADKLMGIVGIENVNRWLETLGIEGISVDRSCQRLILDWLGMPPERTEGMSYREIQDFLDAYKPAAGELEKAAAAFESDPRDSATPIAMNRLLAAIFRGESATDSSRRSMIEILLECETGEKRIKGLLPEKVQVAHKTGTLGGAVNDVGILYLPDGRGHVAVSVLSKGMKDRDKAEQAIAEVARFAYDYFLFASP
jgi:beta-lactamase class A